MDKQQLNALISFSDVWIWEYLDESKGKDWLILGILEFARSNSNPKLSVATIDDFKDDLYAILRSYAKKNVTIHIYTTAKLKQFIKDLEYREEARLNVTSKYTYSFKGKIYKVRN